MPKKLSVFLMVLNIICVVFNIAMGNWDTFIINVVAVFLLGIDVWSDD